MPTWMKVLLAVGVLLVLLILGAVVAGYFAIRKYGPGLVETTKRSMEEGREYGRLTDNEGCVNEAVARQSRAEGLSDLFKNTLFLRPCLEASRPTPGFCDAVPRRTEFMKSVGWQQQQCQRYGLTPEKQCSQLFGQVQQFCEEREIETGEPAPPPPPAPTAPPSRVR